MKNRSLFGSIVLACVLVTGAAVASDYKTYPGGMCLTTSITHVTTHNWARLSDGTMENSETAEYYLCPVVRDTVTETGGINSWSVFVYDGDSSLSFSCSYQSSVSDGTYVLSTSDTTGSASFTGADQLTKSNQTTSVNWGFDYIYCLVPDNSYIRSYYVSERDE